MNKVRVGEIGVGKGCFEPVVLIQVQNGEEDNFSQVRIALTMEEAKQLIQDVNKQMMLIMNTDYSEYI